jgi:Fe2+ transport system protein FeoA
MIGCEMHDNNKPCETRGLVNWLRRQRHFGRDAQAALDEDTVVSSDSEGKAFRGTMYRSGLSLADLQPGECGYVHHLIGSTRGRLRLLEMGLTPGTHVKVMRAAALGGPLDIQLRGYQLSLRRDEAGAVWLDDPDTEQ